MIFLIEYDRPKGKLVRFERFNDEEREKAEVLRGNIELHLGFYGLDHEVVLLEARNEEALRRTHRRYFEDVGQIGRSLNAESI